MKFMYYQAASCITKYKHTIYTVPIQKHPNTPHYYSILMLILVDWSRLIPFLHFDIDF